MRGLAALAFGSWVFVLGGCGSRPPAISDDACREPEARATVLPVCIDTDRGRMSVEASYIPGVVQCELGGSDEGAALEAQAIAARTYLAGYLERKGEDVEVPIGSRFQCWKSKPSRRAVDAALYTADIVLLYDGELVTANYVAGARALRVDCEPATPAENGYDEDDTWAEMLEAYLEARRTRSRRPWSGASWTEVVVTRNEGLRGADVNRTPMAGDHARNRGAMGQNAAVCLARDAGYEVSDILRYFYGDDIELSAPLPSTEDVL